MNADGRLACSYMVGSRSRNLEKPPPRTVSVVVPAYNEEKNLEPAVRDIVLAASTLDGFEIIIVDDGSTDGTFSIAESLAREIAQVSVVRHPKNLGFGAAYLSGLAKAKMFYFTSAPGDHEINIESIKNMFAAVGTADIIVPYHATPWARTWPRRLLTFVSTQEVNILFGFRLPYYQGPTIYPTALARSMPVLTQGFFLPTVMLVNALSTGCSFAEVGLIHQERTYGRSKAVAWGNILSAEWTILRAWWLLRVRKGRRFGLFGRAAPGADMPIVGSDEI